MSTKLGTDWSAEGPRSFSFLFLDIIIFIVFYSFMSLRVTLQVSERSWATPLDIQNFCSVLDSPVCPFSSYTVLVWYPLWLCTGFIFVVLIAYCRGSVKIQIRSSVAGMEERQRRHPRVLTSEVYNDAEATFNLLENKEKLVSLLDCVTLLRAMGMNPTQDDIDYLRERMAEPVLRLEEWRRNEEIRRDKEQRREEMKDRKRIGTVAMKKNTKLAGDRSAEGTVQDGQNPQQPVKITPAEEVKNIDWNIFISCVEEIYRDAVTEQKEVLGALRILDTEGDDSITIDELVELVTTNGESVLNPAEVQQLRSLLPKECSLPELASRLQGTYVPPTKEELERAAFEEIERRRQQEAAAKAAADDAMPLV
ncbi:hypothetical protein, conserved [Trypanosoma brucei gambiense DAL972]|uniref:EF-hand domain-containing protein n=1 Tax=Trypanosoma brucei gambiense (strain MHOM/CI/86/DAL972) TaxID=679716 RepID=D0A550_TRYB9|nr:hypothetical protein, conserved [Trypanosoma brucei gambiense DAL972]CBH16394.1 hypothetical protein, conserved [Trypanosoma brucei gambiense DAL972]|eukprot:XP_011778658.1 hypothetical protein, conserved [Trypanosoma brucei gambiense DAL972]